MTSRSFFEEKRLKYRPKLPKFLQKLPEVAVKEILSERKDPLFQELFPKTSKNFQVQFEEGNTPLSSGPLTVGVLFSGGQAPGGHNVIWGLFNGLKKLNKDVKLFGFLLGPSGLMENKKIKITEKLVRSFHNMGGFDLIGSGRTKIEKPEQLQAALKTVSELNLNGLVIIGGDDSNTNACNLAEYFLANNSSTSVIGVPKTIDGDLKNESIEISFGFDTATKVYSEMIANIARDSISAKKYYHFIKLMGRSASHVALECALQVHPNYTVIGEEVLAKKMTLSQIADEIAELIVRRSEKGKNYGVILVPEGLVEFISEMKQLISELNSALATSTLEKAVSHLSSEAKETYEQLPEKIQHQLLAERDPHGNVQVSLIATEELLIEMVKRKLKTRSDYKAKFSALSHFLGYEGRASFPSNFDATYTYSLGHVAALLIALKKTAVMATLSALTKPVEEWQGGGIPLVSMMQIEMRKGKEVPVIAKKLVELQQMPFLHFYNERESWKLEDDYRYPGPIQFFGPKEITDLPTITLELESLR